MQSLFQDFLYAFRILFKRPGMTVVAIIALAVSIGMTLSTFSMINGVFFKPLPFEKGDQVCTMVMQRENAKYLSQTIKYNTLDELRGLGVFSSVAGFYTGTINVSGDSTPERFDGAFISPDVLSLLRVSPILGQGFSIHTENKKSPEEILLSFDVWQKRFHGDPLVVGKTVRANGEPCTIVGVLPDGFAFPYNTEVWLPVSQDFFEAAGEKSIMPLLRLKDGESKKSAQAAVDHWQKRRPLDAENEDADLKAEIVPFGNFDWNNPSINLSIISLFAIFCILFIACANVANLLIGRALTRGREIAIRSALGASRKKIIHQLLMESFVLTLFGAIGGLLYAAWAVDIAWNSKVLNLPYWMNFGFDWRVFLFLAFLTVMATFLSGFFPAWQSSKTEIQTALKESTHTSTNFRLAGFTRTLAIIQIAFSCALLFAAGLSMRHVWNLLSVESGYDADRILTMRMGLFQKDYPTEIDRDAFYEKLTDRVSRIPGVDTAATTSWISLYGNLKKPFLTDQQKERGSEKTDLAYIESISPEYMDVLRIPILRGRGFLPEDTIDSSPVAIINTTFANRYFPGEDPLGKSVHLFHESTNTEQSETIPTRIIGIVPTVKVSQFISMEADQPIVYNPISQSVSAFMTLSVRVRSGNPHDFATPIQQEILALDPHLPIYFEKTMAEFIDEQVLPFRMMAEGFATIGLMALFLAAVGVYGMVSFGVNQRRRELGIRMALGASYQSIIREIINTGTRQVVLGLFIGFTLAFIIGQATKAALVGLQVQDWRIYLWVLITLLITISISFFFPTRKAIRLSPLEALRYE